MSQNFLISTCLVGILALSPAESIWGDYIDPPDWQDNPCYTHQSWEFNTGANPLAPDSTRHPVDNPYGEPMGEIFPPPEAYTAAWIEDIDANLPGSNRHGTWAFQAVVPEGTYDAVQFTIPNAANPDLKKELMP